MIGDIIANEHHVVYDNREIQFFPTFSAQGFGQGFTDLLSATRQSVKKIRIPIPNQQQSLLPDNECFRANPDRHIQLLKRMPGLLAPGRLS